MTDHGDLILRFPAFVLKVLAALIKGVWERFLPRCEWTQEENPDYNVWESECGHSWVLEEGSPKENDMNYCPFCGRPLKQKLLKDLFHEEEE